ncbi:hypothetical protein [Sinorhizobium meliloti]|uniref:hypothetical protein n=1 Tax=Rhizobium meliloti TaxID=382 RepID=UPI0002E66261|nr:hypothetical protein [Sinorhizobium meliloti]MDE4601391.1 hypothetical protein [Sinorhizobium meliloti]UDU17773.1 hypothetical protein LJD24_08535 [Sinorhizobium meliloti]
MPKPKNPTHKEAKKIACDTIIERAAIMMVAEVGASIPMMIDRMLTYCGAQAATLEGSAVTAEHFRRFADQIEGGLFWSLTGENKPGGGKPN